MSVAISAFALSSCTSDGDVVDNYTKKEATSISISYSTGGATWDAQNPETLELNKIGCGTTGTVPYLIVNSNNYWTIEVPEEYADWLSVSPLGGPEPATTTTNVYITLSENTAEASRDAKIYFNTRAGERFEVPIRQYGNTSSLVFVNETFGDNVTEDTVVKFYTFTNTDGSRSYSGVATAGDRFAYGYSGSNNTFISKDEPSHGYADVVDGAEASGGANVYFDGASYLNVRNFNDQGKTSFRLSFGAKNSDGAFRKQDFKLYISCDNSYWSEMNYNHDVNTINDWSFNYINFSIAPNVSDVLYFKFENVSSDCYRMDDFKVVEKEQDDNDDFFELIVVGSDVIGLPVNFTFNNLRQAERKGQYWENFGFVLSEESGFYDTDASEDIDLASEAFVQFVCGSEESLVKSRTAGDGLLVTSSSPKVTGMWAGDYWIWTIPVYKLSAMTNMLCEFTFMGTDAGGKYHFFESAQCSREDYQFLNTNLFVADDADKRKFYETLDWTVYDPVTIAVPNATDKAATSDGIPVYSSASPAGYWKGDITYSDGFAGGASSYQRVIRKAVTFPDAMDAGYLFVRLRLAANLTCGPTNNTAYQRINTSIHNGTNYLRQTATFSFAGCGEAGAYEDAFKYVALVSNLSAESGYTGGDVTFSNNAKMGLYAGTESNMEATTAGSNQFAGRCATDQSGNQVYAYSPYDASNGESIADAIVSVPTVQVLGEGYLVGDSAPWVISNTPSFKTTSTMRCNFDMVSSLLELDVYSSKIMSDKLSSIELSADTDIAGSYRYNLATGERGETNVLAKTLKSTFPAAAVIPTDMYNPLKTYLAVWEGTHALTVRIQAGGYIYTKTFPATEFVLDKVSTLSIDLSDESIIKTPVSGEVPTAIDSAEKFRQFVSDLASGKSGTALDAYRNIDGTLALGADIDMSEIDMSTWPDATLNEDFNGGNFTIKNLTVATANKALFKNIAYGYTLANVVLDAGCKLVVESPSSTSTYALLVKGEGTGTPMGNIDNVISYATIDVSGDITATSYAGLIFGYACSAPSDSDTQSTVTNCKSYGVIRLHDITQSKIGTEPYSLYTYVGGIFGSNGGLIISGCENHGNVVFENVDRKFGTFFVGGIGGYSMNRDGSKSTSFGDIQNSANYGNFYIGYDENMSPSKFESCTTMIGGIVGRTQWSHLTNDTNYGNAFINATVSDPFANGYTNKGATFDAYIKSTTNGLLGFFFGGIFPFSQCNVTTGAENTGLENYGNITAHVDMPSGIGVADNVGISIGGVMAAMGANAYNPHFNNCSNFGNITVTSDQCSGNVYVGGVMGRMASNRLTANYMFTLNGCANTGTVQFASETDVIAHVGGICGSVIATIITADVNVGAVVNKSTNEASSIGAIIGTQTKSSIGLTFSGQSWAVPITSCGVGGSVNGVKLNNDNYEQYIYGKWESHEPHLTDNFYQNY